MNADVNAGKREDCYRKFGFGAYFECFLISMTTVTCTKIFDVCSTCGFVQQKLNVVNKFERTTNLSSKNIFTCVYVRTKFDCVTDCEIHENIFDDLYACQMNRKWNYFLCYIFLVSRQEPSTFRHFYLCILNVEHIKKMNHNPLSIYIHIYVKWKRSCFINSLYFLFFLIAGNCHHHILTQSTHFHLLVFISTKCMVHTIDSSSVQEIERTPTNNSFYILLPTNSSCHHQFRVCVCVWMCILCMFV